MSEYKGWHVGVTARAGEDGRWMAMIEVWVPGVSPKDKLGAHVPFPKDATTEDEISESARKHAEKWIDTFGKNIADERTRREGEKRNQKAPS